MQLRDIELRLRRIQDFKLEQDAARSAREEYARNTDEYLNFLAQLRQGEQVQQNNLDRLKFEASLVNMNANERTLALATYDAEFQAKQKLLELNRLVEVGDRKAIERSIQLSKERTIQAAELKLAIEENKKSISAIDQFGIQAARNLQTHFADFLFDPFDKGLKGMLSGFIDVVRRMAAEAAAAQLLNALGLGSGAAGGGLLSGLFSGVGSFFGGFFASGGDHRGGLRVVGENGPEIELTGPSRIFR